MDILHKFAFIYFIGISLISLFITIKDKRCAVKHRRRIKEKTLFLLSAFGGSIAMLLTMVAVRHKTKHKRFMLGIPVIIFIQSIMLVLLHYCLR